MLLDIQRKNVKASAVCRFSLSDVQQAFLGPYMENQDSGSNWKEYLGKIPDPRPGTVSHHPETFIHAVIAFEFYKLTIKLIFEQE